MVVGTLAFTGAALAGGLAVNGAMPVAARAAQGAAAAAVGAAIIAAGLAVVFLVGRSLAVER